MRARQKSGAERVLDRNRKQLEALSLDVAAKIRRQARSVVACLDAPWWRFPSRSALTTPCFSCPRLSFGQGA